MFCVGLIGNLASGKSTVAAYFAELGAIVINADTIAKELTAPNQPSLLEIAHHFGLGIVKATGELNRSELRQIIFKHPEERLWLEQYLHPKIRQQIKLKIDQATGPYCIIEIPLLKNKKDFPYLNWILLIKTDRALQIKRFTIRDKSTEEDARAILATQSPEELLVSIADDIIENDGSLEDLKTKVSLLHKKWVQYSKAQ